MDFSHSIAIQWCWCLKIPNIKEKEAGNAHMADSVITKVHVILLLLCVRMLCAPILANVNLPVDLLLPNTSMVFAIHWLSLDKCNSSFIIVFTLLFQRVRSTMNENELGTCIIRKESVLLNFVAPKLKQAADVIN